MGSENLDLHSFYTQKITRWKGNYPRIFSLGTHGLGTYSPNDGERTNYWQWTEVFNLAPLSTADHPHQFQLVHRKGKGSDSMRFETEHRTEVLTTALQQRGAFAKSHQTENMEKGTVNFGRIRKYRWGQDYVTEFPSFTVTCIGVEQMSREGEKKSYYYKDIDSFIELKTDPDIFALQMRGTNRLHIFSHPDRSKIIHKMKENASFFIGIVLNSVTSDEPCSSLLERRLGNYSGDEHLTSLSEFPVQNSKRGRVLLCLTETCLLERDPGTYCIISLFPLSSLFALIRLKDDLQSIGVELNSGSTRIYFSTERDSLLASLMDGSRASGNCSVHVKSKFTPQGKRWGPLLGPVDEKVESLFLKFIHQPPPSWSFPELLLRFNANVEYSGLIHSVTQDGFFAENKEKLILVALNALLIKDISGTDYEEYFQLIRRIVCSKTGFGAFAEMQTFREKIGSIVVSALRSNSSDDCVIFSALDVMAALMQPMHSEADLRQEQENKEKILNSPKFLDSLLDMWTSHVKRGTGALVTIAMLDILTFALCPPYSETTMGSHFDLLLKAVAQRAHVLFQLFQHPCVAIVKGAGLVMKALIEEGQGSIGTEMQDMALKEGALLRHLLNALYLQTNDPRLLTLRQLSRHLVSLWTCQNTLAFELLQRILPPGLLRFLDSNEVAIEKEFLNTRDNLKIAQAAHLQNQPTEFSKQVRNVEKYIEKQVEVALRHWRLKTAQEVRTKNQLRPVALRKRRQNLKIEGNWALLYSKFSQDHSRPDLLWNYPVREELREALQNEIKLLDGDRDHVTDICWNYSDFQVQFKCLNDEINIGGYYLRLLLEDETVADSFIIRNPKDFFSELYHRFLLTGKPDMRGLCLQAMTRVYSKYYEDIGTFSDLKYIVIMLDKSTEKIERDRLLQFISKLVQSRENARELVNCGGLKTLVDLLPLAHLHTSRAMIPTQSNVIEAGAEMKHADCPEWYYMSSQAQGPVHKIGPVGFQQLKKLYEKGKIDAKTKIWATGLETWKHLSAIPQLKWFILSEKQSSIYNETKLARLILDTLIKVVGFCPAKIGNAIIRPVHKAKQLLSDTNYLAHIVQLLLTFDPEVVERTATLLHLIMDENPILSRAYITGVFFFIMMYTGSNILPISRFLQLTHLKQNTFTAQQGSSVWQRSILGPLLPEAMVAYLENHGIEKFSEIYLGEFDTPEAIWSAEMRRHLIERIALHLSDFTPRLLSNTRALYDYCAIPAVTYPTLETELFCNIYYLRNLTDEVRFPSWPIKDPLGLLKDVLEAWKNEVEKKPPLMTVTEALISLELADDPDWSNNVKRNYRKLAQKYHPDKNPEGRERFEEANRAYEFLCSRSSNDSGDPDPNRILLILKCQSILFKRYGAVLEPYKYAGYPMLIKTMEMEVADDALFAKATPLLGASSELVYHTLNCSALNVEELRREKGLDLLLRALDRCVSVLNASSNMNDIGPQVCLHVTRCFAVSTKFQLCRDKLVEMPQLAQDISRILHFNHLTKLNCVAAEAIAAMAVDTILQMHLLQSGVLWHLLKALFNYDFTLEEAGVEAAEESNKQILVNNFAKLSIVALKALAGDCSGGERPRNDVIRASLDSLILPYSAKLVREKEPEIVLKLLNENCTTPYLIWNNSTRNELLEYCDTQLQCLRSGDITDMTYGSDFTYSLHQGELVIGSIFVRVYNIEPTFNLENPKDFVHELLAYLSNNDPTASTPPNEVTKIEQCITALGNVVKNNANLEGEFKGKFRLIARYLMCPYYEKGILILLTSLMANQGCVTDIVGMGIVPALLIVSATAQNDATNVIVLCLTCLSMIVTHPQVAKEAIQKGSLVYLSDFFCTPNIDPLIRSKSAEVLSKLCSDKLSGPRIKILLSKFFPSIFYEAMSESAQAAIQLFDSVTENPEIVWNEVSKANVMSSVKQMKSELFNVQKYDLSVDWKLPDESWQVDYQVDGELVIGGIYIRLYVSSPGWNLRKPREFLRELLDYVFSPSTTNKSDEFIDLAGSALGHLLGSQPNLSDALPPMGYIQTVLQSMDSKRTQIQRSAAITIRSISSSHSCIEALSQLQCIGLILNGMKNKTETLPIIIEALNSLYSAGKSELVGQGLDVGLVPFLLNLLKHSRDLGPSPGSTKAYIVKILQNMSQDERFGGEIDKILSKSEIWAQYRDQKHDLFLTDKPLAGYLTSSSSSVSGYLTQGPAGTKSSILQTPPPLIE